MAKIDPIYSRMYNATNQASKDKIAKERYGEFGFDTLKYEEQQQVYKDNPGLQGGKKDKFKDFETKSPLYVKLTAKCKAAARRKFDIYPSAYANIWASKQQKKGKC